MPNGVSDQEYVDKEMDRNLHNDEPSTVIPHFTGISVGGIHFSDVSPASVLMTCPTLYVPST